MRNINFNRAYETVGKIAESLGKKYWSVDVSKTPYEGVTIRGYIDGYSWTQKRDNLKDLFADVKKMIGKHGEINNKSAINIKS